MQFLVALSFAAVTAACPPPRPETGHPIDYVRTFVDALAVAHESGERAQAGPVADDEQARIRAFIALMKLRLADDDCIVARVSPFKASGNKAIATSATNVAVVFEGLADVTRKTVDAQERYLEGKLPLERLLLFMEKSSGLVDELWRMLPRAAVTATVSLIEVDAGGLATGRLTITESERTELLASLRTTFGPEIEKGVQVGQTPLVSAAAALAQFLTARGEGTKQVARHTRR